MIIMAILCNKSLNITYKVQMTGTKNNIQRRGVRERERTKERRERHRDTEEE